MGTTTNYSWTTPTVGASDDTWGTTLNTTIQAIDTQMALAAFLADNETVTGNWQFDGTVDVTAAATFTGNVIVPSSTTSTHALNVTTADSRYAQSSALAWTIELASKDAAHTGTTCMSTTVTSGTRVVLVQGYIDIDVAVGSTNNILIEGSDDSGSSWETIAELAVPAATPTRVSFRCEILFHGYSGTYTRRIADYQYVDASGNTGNTVSMDTTTLSGLTNVRVNSETGTDNIDSFDLVVMTRKFG